MSGSMNIPKKIKVGGLIYSVLVVDSIPDSSSSGLTDHSKQVIYIRKMEIGRMEQTFWHEVFHCINNELNEIDTEFYGIALYQFIKENKSIWLKQ